MFPSSSIILLEISLSLDSICERKYFSSGLVPNTFNNNVEINVIIIIGINTKNQAITLYPKSHKILIIIEKTIITINLINASFTTPLYKSINICINEKPIKIIVGTHFDDKIILY